GWGGGGAGGGGGGEGSAVAATRSGGGRRGPPALYAVDEWMSSQGSRDEDHPQPMPSSEGQQGTVRPATHRRKFPGWPWPGWPGSRPLATWISDGHVAGIGATTGARAFASARGSAARL